MNRKDKKSNKGLSVVGSIALIPLIFIGLIVLLFFACELNKAYWDYRVAQMCEEDGGVEIYEPIEVTPEEFAQMPRVGAGKSSRVAVLTKQTIRKGSLIYAESESSILKEGFPRIRKDVSIVKGLGDQTVIARMTSYSRVGGDFPTGLAHTSSFICPPNNQINPQIDNIFIIKER